ncbi:MAG: hypothetical protein SGJ02_08975 [bacterium]|nr:hypothetical protein [bacterium]
MEQISGLKNSVNVLSSKAVAEIVAPSKVEGKSFGDIFNKASNTQDIHKDLIRLTNAMLSGKNLSPQELLFYQIRAGQFGLQVELLSKLGESLSATVKKLEQGH